MLMPSRIDEMVRLRFVTLIEESDELLQLMRMAVERERARGELAWESGILREQTAFYCFRTKLLSLLYLLCPGAQHTAALVEDVKTATSTITDLEKLAGIVQGLKDDYESGMLADLASMIEANVTADYLGQAEGLLEEGQSGRFDHVPAAVLTGAILEDALRRLCLRQSPSLETKKPSGQPKTLNALIDDLKKAGLFNELKAKQLRAWADIRNAAAHGEFDKFNRSDVEQMLAGAQVFLADYL